MIFNKIFNKSKKLFYFRQNYFNTANKSKDNNKSEDIKIEHDAKKIYREQMLKSEDFDSLKKPYDELEDDDFLPDYFVKDAPIYKKNSISINLPWLINGSPELEIKVSKKL